MKFVRTWLVATMCCSLAGAAQAEVKGWGAGAGVMDGDFAVQLRKDFWLGGDISQITGQAGASFHKKTVGRIDADYHFILNPRKPSRFYPLVGLQFAFNSDHVEFGINGGGGVNFKLTPKLAAFAEVKYVFSDWDGLSILGGLYF
jgi:hypothetical protein